MTLPDRYLDETLALLGEERFRKYMEAMSEEPQTSIRLNPLKAGECGTRSNACPTTSPLPELEGSRPVPWCPEGFYLPRRPHFTFSPPLHQGVYYVQEASSMFISHVLRQWQQRQGLEEPLTLLDMCAAPGGKTTAAISALPEGSLVVSNEPIRQRASILVENLSKWGYDNSMVSCNMPRDWAETGETFDVVVCDVPCSGEGMFRKDPVAISEWSWEKVYKSQQLGRDIAAMAWECLKPGGLMIYSTCTLNPFENENNIEELCWEGRGEPFEVETPLAWGIMGALGPAKDRLRGVWRFIPGFTEGEGLTMAAIIKAPATHPNATNPHCRVGTAHCGRPLAAKMPAVLENHERYVSVPQGDTLMAMREEMGSLYSRLKGRLNILKAGITIGRMRGKDMVPAADLCLAASFRRGTYDELELDLEGAIAYLRRSALSLPPETPHGLVVATYMGRPLGWMKNIGPRANNLYPQEWRIRSQHDSYNQ